MPQIFAFGFSRDCSSTSFHGKPRYDHMKWNLGYILAPVLPQKYGFSFDSFHANLVLSTTFPSAGAHAIPDADPFARSKGRD